MSSNLNKAKVRVLIALAMIALVLILVVTAFFIKNNAIVNKIRENIEQGSANLDLEKINEAKKNFEQAISLKQENNETYILIKDEYLKSGRLDDALWILKEGKNNKIIGLESLIEEIKQKFEVSSFEDIVHQNETYSFPQKTIIKINNEDISVPVKWKEALIETSKLGDFVFEGVSEEYERPIKLTLL